MHNCCSGDRFGTFVLPIALLEDELPPTAAVTPPSALVTTFLGGGLTEAVSVIVGSDPLLGIGSPHAERARQYRYSRRVILWKPFRRGPTLFRRTRHYKRYTAECRGAAAAATAAARLRNNIVGVNALTISMHAQVFNPYQLHTTLKCG